MLKFESFNLPTDGLTRVCKLDHYTADALLSQGWTMVGLAESTSKDEEGTSLFGVYRLTETEALRSAIEKTAAAEKKQGELQSKAYDLERQLKDATSRAASLAARVDDSDERARLIGRARERFGQAFVELEKQG